MVGQLSDHFFIVNIKIVGKKGQKLNFASLCIGLHILAKKSVKTVSFRI
jgi:hypothetical protein